MTRFEFGGRPKASGERPPRVPIQVRVLKVTPAEGNRRTQLSVSEGVGKPVFTINVVDAEMYEVGNDLLFTRERTNIDDGSETGKIERATEIKVQPNRESVADDRRSKAEAVVEDGFPEGALAAYGRTGGAEEPDDATPEELAALIEEVTGKPAQKDARKERRERQVKHETVIRRAGPETYVTVPGHERLAVKLKGALPRDRVIVVLEERKVEGVMQLAARVEEVLERYSYEAVATLRYEEQEGQTALVAHVDSSLPALARRIITLHPTAIAAIGSPNDIPPEGLKIILRRATHPSQAEWHIAEVLGVAGSAKAEVESIARATGVGSQEVEDMTTADMEVFAESIKAEAPLLAERLRKVTREQIQRETAELQSIANDRQKNKLSVENLVRRLLKLPEGWGKPKALVTDREQYVSGKNRLDARTWETLNIDPETAEDFDDALSYRVLPNGNVEVGVHIADVTAFVKQFSALDLVAQFRQMTRYLKAKVIPLFPKVLANILCSLKEGEDRLAYSVVFTFDPDGNQVGEPWMGRSVISSKKRYDYEGAQRSLDRPRTPGHDTLNGLQVLAQAYRKTRGVSLSTSGETEFILDDDGEPIRAVVKPQLGSNLLIEDWMVRANEAVVRRIVESMSGEAVAFIRIHRPPDPDRILEVLEELGYEDIWNGEGAYEPHAILEQIRARIDAEPDALVRADKDFALVLSMKRAGYEVVASDAWDEEGGTTEAHFGLALRWYGHFTSPIRRYPDIIQHRLLEAVEAGNPVSTFNTGALAELMELAELANDREVRYDKAERDVRAFLGLKLLSKRLAESGGVTQATVQRRRLKSVRLRFMIDGAPFDQDVHIDDIASVTKSSREKVWRALEEGSVFTMTPTIDLSLRRMKVSVDMRETLAAIEQTERAAKKKREFEALAALPQGTSVAVRTLSGKPGEPRMMGIFEWKPGQKTNAIVTDIGVESLLLTTQDGGAVTSEEWERLGIVNQFVATLAGVDVEGEQVRLVFAHTLSDRPAKGKPPASTPPRT